MKKQNYFNINHNGSLLELVCPRYANIENYKILCDLAVKLESHLPGITESIKYWSDLQCQDKLEKIDYWQVFVIYFNNIPIGITGLYELNGEAWLGWTGLLNEYRNKGMISAILPLLADYLKNKLSLNTLNVFTYSDGRRNSFYERNGFTYSMTVGDYMGKNPTVTPDEFGDDMSDLIFTKKL